MRVPRFISVLQSARERPSRKQQAGDEPGRRLAGDEPGRRLAGDEPGRRLAGDEPGRRLARSPDEDQTELRSATAAAVNSDCSITSEQQGLFQRIIIKKWVCCAVVHRSW